MIVLIKKGIRILVVSIITSTATCQLNLPRLSAPVPQKLLQQKFG
jgi:hypothetical protein